MKTYKLELTVKAKNASEGANKLFDELYNGSDNMYIEASDMKEVKPRKVVIEVLGGVADVSEAPDDVEVEIINHDNE